MYMRNWILYVAIALATNEKGADTPELGQPSSEGDIVQVLCRKKYPY